MKRALFFCLILASFATADEPPAKPGLRCLVFSPDGKLLAGSTGEPSGPGEAFVWSVADGSLKMAYENAAGVSSVAFSPDGKSLAIGGYTHVARLLDAETGKVLREFRGHDHFVRSVAFAGEGTLVTGSFDKTLKLWDVKSGDLRATLRGHEGAVASLAVTADGKTAVTTSQDHTARRWNLAAGKEKSVLLRSKSSIPSVAAVPESEFCVTCCWDGWIRVHERDSERPRAQLKIYANLAQLSSDHRTLAVINPPASGKATVVHLYDLPVDPPGVEANRQTQTLIAALDNDDYATRERAENELTKLGFAAEPQLRSAFIESSSAEVRIRARRIRENIRSPEPLATLFGHGCLVQCIAFAPGGKVLASGDERGNVKLWDVSDPRDGGKEIATLARPQ